MVAAEIGEGGGGEIEPVEPVLVEAMARGFERQMVHAGARQRLQLLMKLDRIGGGQAARLVDAGRDDADGAHARRLDALALPELAREDGD